MFYLIKEWVIQFIYEMIVLYVINPLFTCEIFYDMSKNNNKTPVVASPKVSISHQQSKKAATAMNKVHVTEKNETKVPKETKKILVALDGSEKSTEALEYAVNLNKKLGAEMVLFTVYQNIVYPWIGPVYGSAPHVTPSYMNDFYTEQKKYSQKILDEAQKKVEEMDPKFKVSTKIVDGGPSTKIVEEAMNDYDLIIMGSRGHGFLEELILGSVSKRVVDESRIPVLVVK